MKSTIARAQCIAPGTLAESNGARTGINYRIIALCSTPVHCFTSLKRLKRLRPVKGGTHRKRSSSCIDPEDSLIVLSCRFFLRTAGNISLVKDLTHVIKYMVMPLRSWWRTSIIIALWMLTYGCFQAKFSTSWTQVSSVFARPVCHWQDICCCMSSCVRSSHCFVRFSLSCGGTVQTLQCWAFLIPVIKTCSS